MTGDFTHLHLHSLYSLLDGAIRMSDLVKVVKERNMSSVAVTDHGNMFGTVDFYKKAKAEGLKPILGCEVYVAGPKGRKDKSERIGHHLILLAENLTGYKNLRYLCSMGFLEGFYYDPRVDKELIRAHSEGIFGLTACMAGEVPRAARRGDMDGARKSALELKSIFQPGHLFLEVQSNDLPEQIKVNDALKELSRDIDVPLVATADAHYVSPEQARAHEVLMCIASGKTLEDQRRLKHETEQLYIKRPDEMLSYFSDIPEAVHNTQRIADACNVELDLKSTYLPNYKVPDGETLESWLLKRGREGLARRFKELPYAVEQDRYRERLEQELKVVMKMGFAGYFLIVQDFINWAKERGIPVGPGRGSGAGSLVAWSLRITDLDPLPYNLLFERFLNPERVSMPDFDVDFCQDRRGEVISYVTEKYGKDNVGQIITFGSLKARSVIRDVCRVMGLSFAEGDRIAKLVPEVLGITLKEAIEQEPRLRALRDEKPEYKEVLDIAMALEGLHRNAGMHAAGVVIAENPLWEYVPVYRGQNGELVTQFAKDEVELAGLVKFDFLGLKTLTVIDEAVKLANKSRAEPIDLARMTYDDPAPYALVSRGDTGGVFQMESSGFTEMVKKLKPSVFEDIIAAGALYRPGPLDSGMVDVFIDRKHGKQKTTYPHPLLEPILRDTYGVIVYQEQVMQIAQVLGGYSLGRADLLRRAMGKKKADVMAKERSGFLEGCEKNKVDPRVAGEIFDLMEKFAEYGFNKCLIGSTQVTDARTGEVSTVGGLFQERRAVTIHALADDGKLRARRVTNVMWNGRKPVFELRTAQGKRITATANHPFRVLDGWRQLGELKVGDRIAAPRKLPVSTGERWPAHEIICLAGLLSEGNTCHPSSLYFFNNRRDLIDDFAQAAGRFPRTVARIDVRPGRAMEVCVNTGRKDGYRPWNAGRSAGNVALQASPEPVRSGAFEWAGRLGILGKTATQKAIPPPVFALRDQDLELFLGRLWSGDGFVANRTNFTPFYATSSRELAAGVQTLLLRLGIVSGVHEKSFKYRGGQRPGFTVHVVGEGAVETFARRIAPQCIGREAQIALLAEHLGATRRDQTSKDTLPAEIRRWVNDERKNAGLTWVELEEQSDVSVKELQGEGGPLKKGFRRGTIAKLAAFFGSQRLRQAADSDVFWDRVVSIEPKGVQDTYDLTVEHDHNFVADGLIVHNSHSAAYAVLSYQTAWLKAHHPVEFMAALLTSIRDDTDKVVAHIADARAMGIEVLPPDANESEMQFGVARAASARTESGASAAAGSPRGGKIRFGLGAIKGVGEAAVEGILAARAEGGPFKGLFDFTGRVDLRKLNKKVLEALVAAGAFDFTRAPRRALTLAVDRAIEQGGNAQRDRAVGQKSLFDMLAGGGEGGSAQVEERYDKVDEFPERERLFLEKSALGFYITGHPLDRYADDLKRYATHTCAALGKARAYEKAAVAGIVAVLRERPTKTGKRIAFVTLEDLTGTRELIIFHDLLERCEDLLKSDEPLLFRGQTQERRGMNDEDAPTVELKCEEVVRLSDVRASKTSRLEVRVEAGQLTAERAQKLRELLAKSPGGCEVTVLAYTPRAEARVQLKAYPVQPSDDLLAAVDRLFGGRVAALR